MVFHGLMLCEACFYLLILSILNKVGSLVLIAPYCSFMPGQYTVSLALILHLLRPR